MPIDGFYLVLKGEKKWLKKIFLRQMKPHVRGSVINETEAKIAPEREYVRYIVLKIKKCYCSLYLYFLYCFTIKSKINIQNITNSYKRYLPGKVLFYLVMAQIT